MFQFQRILAVVH